MPRKLFAVGALLLATMCLSAPAAYADVGLALDPVIAVDQVVPADCLLAATAPAVDFAVPLLADLPGSGGYEGPIAAIYPNASPLAGH